MASPPSRSSRLSFELPRAAANHLLMDSITVQDYLENPEIKVYVEDALRLVLTARPERPLDFINEYLQSVLALNNVVGREYAYVNATMRNRRAFVIAVHEIFVGTDDINGHDSSVPARSVAYKGTRVPAASAMESEVRRARRRERTSGFEQRDLVHLLGLVCPDFPEEMIGWEFFEDICVLFSSMVVGVPAGGKGGDSGGIEDAWKVGEVNLRILLDQLQLMKAELRNQLRYMEIRSAELAARKGGLGERVTLPSLLACLLLHSDEVAKSLVERPVADHYAELLEACPALWRDGNRVGSSGETGDAAVESLGRLLTDVPVCDEADWPPQGAEVRYSRRSLPPPDNDDVLANSRRPASDIMVQGGNPKKLRGVTSWSKFK